MTAVSAITSFGLLVGLCLAGLPGAIAGAVLGAAVGLVWSRATAGQAPVPTLDERELLCLRKLEKATVRLVRDDAGGRWMDAVSCSLCHPPGDLSCGRPCVQELNDGLPAAPVR